MMMMMTMMPLDDDHDDDDDDNDDDDDGNDDDDDDDSDDDSDYDDVDDNDGDDDDDDGALLCVVAVGVVADFENRLKKSCKRRKKTIQLARTGCKKKSVCCYVLCLTKLVSRFGNPQALKLVLDSYVIEHVAESQGRPEVVEAMRVRSALADGSFTWDDNSIAAIKKHDGDDGALDATTLVLGETIPGTPRSQDSDS